MVKSLATGKTDYVSVRLRKADACRLHLQGEGASVNRNYGISGNIAVTPDFANYINNLPKDFYSLAGTGRQYVNAQVAIREDTLHFQVNGVPFDGNGHRDYGAILDISVDSFFALADFVRLNQVEDVEDEGSNCDCCQPTCCQ